MSEQFSNSFPMDQSLRKKLLQSRQAIKKKFDSLRTDIVHHENYLEKKFKPIADPLKELLKNIKTEKTEIKQEPFNLSFSSPKAISSPKQNRNVTSTKAQPVSFSLDKSETPRPRQPTFLESEPVAQYEPIQEVQESDEFVNIDPEKLWQNMETSTAVKEYLDSFGGLSREYISGLLTDTIREYDTTFGPRREILKDQDGKQYDTGKWLLGNSYIDFSKRGDLIRITTPDRKTFDYKGSVALYELIFKNLPNKATVSKDEQARRDYKDIIDRTSLHRSGFSSAGKVKSNQGRKYMDFIKVILQEDFNKPRPIQSTLSRRQSQSFTKQGQGFLKLENKKVQYVPYKNPNTLVNRLKILMGSQLAGNTSHDNEIVYIIEELRRNKTIK